MGAHSGVRMPRPRRVPVVVCRCPDLGDRNYWCADASTPMSACSGVQVPRPRWAPVAVCGCPDPGGRLCRCAGRGAGELNELALEWSAEPSRAGRRIFMGASLR